MIPIKESIADAAPGDGSFAGARKLYLMRGLQMPLIERLRAVEALSETARLIQNSKKFGRSLDVPPKTLRGSI